MRDQRRAKWVVVVQLAGCCLLAGLLAAAVMFPFVGGAGTTILRVSNSATEESTQLLEGEMPIVSTMVDAAGNPIAWLYEQRRWVVPSNRIANTMKLAIIAIEDKRFTEHDGVDWQGTLTGLAGYPRALRPPGAGRRSSSSTSRISTSSRRHWRWTRRCRRRRSWPAI